MGTDRLSFPMFSRGFTRYRDTIDTPKDSPMQLTTYTDYALRVLIYLAVYDDRLVTIADITNAYGISKNHLMKIVHHLAQRGWITTTRGRRGRVRLAHPPT